MTSTLKFYNVPFTIEHNAIVENHSEYIEYKTPIRTIEDFQYIRQGENITIKIDYDSENIELRPTDNIGNYVSIQNIDDGATSQNHIIHYYFITRRRQVGQETIELTLKLDILNTFPLGTSYELTDKTFTIREHKDRFYDIQHAYVDVETGKTYFLRKIDRVSENPNNKMILENRTVINDDIESPKWNMVYVSNSTESNKPLDIYFIPDYQTRPFYVATDRWLRFDRESISAGENDEYRYMTGSSIGGTITGTLEFTKSNGTVEQITISPFTMLWLVRREPAYRDELHVVEYRDNNTAIVRDVYSLSNTTDIKIKSDYVFPIYKTPNPTPSVLYFSTTTTEYTNSRRAYWVNQNTVAEISPVYNVDSAYIQLNDFNSIDRTNTRILKIIKTPYAPFTLDYHLEGNKKILDIPSWIIGDRIQWGETGAYFTYLKVSKDYTGLFTKRMHTLIFQYGDLFYEIPSSDTRDDYAESKIKHSDFQYAKFVYDSFVFDFRSEDVGDYYPSAVEDFNPKSRMDIEYTVSSSMSSRFMFKFFSQKKYKDKDYDNILTVARNNEIQLYNSAYLDYIRNGYNYDVKNKQIIAESGLINAGVSVINNLLQGNFLGATFSTVNAGINAISQAELYENGMQAKLSKLKEQSITVSGSDDLDFLTAYSNNNAEYLYYKCEARVEENALNTFYYYGYLSNRVGIPNLTGRKWFNFIKANIDVKIIDDYLLQYKESLKQLYADGVTIYHDNGYYDFDQTKANNELFIEEFLHG